MRCFELRGWVWGRDIIGSHTGGLQALHTAHHRPLETASRTLAMAQLSADAGEWPGQWQDHHGTPTSLEKTSERSSTEICPSNKEHIYLHNTTSSCLHTAKPQPTGSLYTDML